MRSHLMTVVFCGVSSFVPLSAQSPAARQQVIAIRAGTLFDGTGEGVVSDVTILVVTRCAILRSSRTSAS